MITELSRVSPISKLTKILKVPKSTYYYRKLNKLTPNKIKRDKLSKLIYEIWLRSHKRYGAPKIHQELIKSGEFHSLKHIQNLMREKDIKGIPLGSENALQIMAEGELCRVWRERKGHEFGPVLVCKEVLK